MWPRYDLPDNFAKAAANAVEGAGAGRGPGDGRAPEAGCGPGRGGVLEPLICP